MAVEDNLLDRVDDEGPAGRNAGRALEALRVEDPAGYWALIALLADLYERIDRREGDALAFVAQREGLVSLPGAQ